jgi:hypothetical protein
LSADRRLAGRECARACGEISSKAIRKYRIDMARGDSFRERDRE